MKISEIMYNHYLGEAYYVRATVFYTMAKRFGGVPLVTKVIQYPADATELEVPRASEEETWGQVLADYDKAIELLQPTSPKQGYCNKYKALAWKSEAMLYAGSVAKYNQTVAGHLTGLGKKTGVRVMGFAPDRWEAASHTLPPHTLMMPTTRHSFTTARYRVVCVLPKTFVSCLMASTVIPMAQFVLPMERRTLQATTCCMTSPWISSKT